MPSFNTRPCTRCGGDGTVPAPDSGCGDRVCCPRCKGSRREMTQPETPLLEVYVIFDDDFEAREFLASVQTTGRGHGIRLVDRRKQLGGAWGTDLWLSQ